MAGERWIPTTEDELRTALAGRILVEGHYVDFKAQIPPGDKGNLGLAIDLASFAVDSGIIVVGVDESSDPPVAAPIVFAGLKERARLYERADCRSGIGRVAAGVSAAFDGTAGGQPAPGSWLVA